MKWEILFLDTIFNLNKNVWMGIRLQKENLNGKRNGISLDPYFFTAFVTIFLICDKWQQFASCPD